MALKDEFETRIPLQRRIELSNASDDLTSGAGQDDAKVNAAVDDVTGDFVTYAGVVLDDITTPSKEHIAHGVQGVLLYLEAYKGDTSAWEKVEAWRRNVTTHLRQTQGNNRIVPKSSSALTPSDESPGGETVRPDFDPNSGFTDTTPEQRQRGRLPRNLF